MTFNKMEKTFQADEMNWKSSNETMKAVASIVMQEEVNAW